MGRSVQDPRRHEPWVTVTHDMQNSHEGQLGRSLWGWYDFWLGSTFVGFSFQSVCFVREQVSGSLVKEDSPCVSSCRWCSIQTIHYLPHFILRHHETLSTGGVFVAWLKCVQALTKKTARMKSLPSWFHRGCLLWCWCVHRTTCGRGARSQALHLSQIVVCKMESLPVRLKFEGRHQRPSLIELVSVFFVWKSVWQVCQTCCCQEHSCRCVQEGSCCTMGCPWWRPLTQAAPPWGNPVGTHTGTRPGSQCYTAVFNAHIWMLNPFWSMGW